MPKRQKKHKTTHAAEAHEGKVIVLCETCEWRAEVDVSEMSYVDALKAIFAARDRHEADPARGTAKE
jgi:hypothetical protein